ncbi:MAG: hypothetical protein FJ086_08025 [Deltaproteobacteria bacterium]|nr:hypothetical protein [Deltaproteobacteria bacterium]
MRPVLLTLLLSLGLPLAAAGQEGPDLRELSTARALGMGGAYRALGIAGEAVVGNPAAMSLYRRYAVDVTGAYDLQSKYAFGNATIVDSQTNVLAAGVAYHLVTLGSGEQQRLTHHNTLALSFPLSDVLMIGTSGKYLLTSGAISSNAVTLDVGVLVRLLGLVVGVSGHNLVDISNPDATRYYALSLGYGGGGPLNLALDLRSDLGPRAVETLTVNAGVEYVLGQLVPVRVGYSNDRRLGRQDLSVGTGFVVDSTGVDVAYRRELDGKGQMLLVTFRLQAGR